MIESPGSSSIVPRNVEVMLAGDLSTLDPEPPLSVLRLVATASGTDVPLERRGSIVRPTDHLAPNESYEFRVEGTDASGCPACVTANVTFTTNDVIDLDPPSLEELPRVDIYILPTTEEALRCGTPMGSTHQFSVMFQAPEESRLTAVARRGDGPATPVLAGRVGPWTSFLSGNAGSTLPVAIGDAFDVGFSLRDLAGNESEARIVRTRARSFEDRAIPLEETTELTCTLPSGPQVRAPALLPTNGQLVVEFPLEERPLALRPHDDTVANARDDATLIPLVPVEEAPGGRVYTTAVPLAPDTSFDVVGLPCPNCVCPTCASPDAVVVHTGPGADATAPAAPELVDVFEDNTPKPAIGEPCYPDRRALLVVVTPGVDDTTPSADLRYDATLRFPDEPPRPFATAAQALERADGTFVVRMETTSFGPMLGRDFEISVVAVDAAGNRSVATLWRNDAPSPDAGCVGARGGTSHAALFALLLLGVRRTRRRPAAAAGTCAPEGLDRP